MSLCYCIEHFDEVKIYNAIYVPKYTIIDVSRVEVALITTACLFLLDSMYT